MELGKVYKKEQMLIGDDDATRGAVISECGKYRYRLWRYWRKDVPPLVFIMLNPSTATAETNDPTVERCERRARKMGYGGLEVVNLFAYRATDPMEMKRQADPVGPENDAHILEVVERCTNQGRNFNIIAGWGTHGKHRGRGARVIAMLRAKGYQVECLTLTKGNQPGHPLYVGYDAVPMTYWVDEDLDCSRCFHHACCVCFSVGLRGKEKERFEHDGGGKFLKREGAGQCIHLNLETGACKTYQDRPEECRNWSCKRDPRWPVVLEAYLSGKDKCTRNPTKETPPPELGASEIK